jgi:hypothetical protein
MTSKPKTRTSAAGAAKAKQSSTDAGRSKLDQIISLLSRPGGASLAELVAVTGWQPHSVRGALAGSLKRKGHDIRSENLEGERRYRIGAAP